ncbi:hypothetical protein GIB67_041110, partial [Kingdonia uniflora]
GERYGISDTYLHVKDAEQAVAKHAYECILKKIREEGCPIVNEDTTLNKIILNEFAIKMKLDVATYTTAQAEGMLPIFKSTVVFGCKSFQGGCARSKKDAEQLAAGTIIRDILANSTSGGPVLFQIIKSKRKSYAINNVKNFIHHKSLPSRVNPVNGSKSSMTEKPVVRECTEMPSIADPIPAFEQPHNLPVLPYTSIKKEPLCETTTDSIGDVPSGMKPSYNQAEISSVLDGTVSNPQATTVDGTNRKKRPAEQMKGKGQKKKKVRFDIRTYQGIPKLGDGGSEYPYRLQVSSWKEILYLSNSNPKHCVLAGAEAPIRETAEGPSARCSN